ncbi:MAG: NAD-dependent epimerase/dehydratase family protein [Solirubrobacteraceae bacterium]
MARTLVTGATGFIGSQIVALLVQRGDEVVVTVRDGSALDRLTGLDVKTTRADILDRRSIRRAMRGIECVFHAAGRAELNATRARIFSLNVEGTRIVLEEALRAGVQRVVYTSSVAAIGPAPPGESADETTVWEAGRYRIAYLDAQHEAETAALRLVARGLPLVIVNPSHVLGPGTGPHPPFHPPGSTTMPVRRFLNRQIPAYVNGTLNVVGVQDVARGHLLAQERGQVGERYILGNRNFTLDRLFADLGRLSGIEPPAIKLPLTVALAVAAAGGRFAGDTMPTATEIRAASLNWAFVNRKAKRDLGWRPSPHEDCLEETVAWYQEHDASTLPARGARQPLALRIAGGALRRTGL